MNFAEVGLTYISVLLIGIFVSDRIAIAQWGLTRTIANLLRGLCFQMTLPLAAELGHDHAIGARDSLQRLYARGSIVLMLFVSAATSGALAFWPDFFAIWTHGAIPYDATLAIMLLLGTCIARAGHSGAELRKLQQSRHAAAVDQIAAARDISGSVDRADSAPGSAWVRRSRWCRATSSRSPACFSSSSCGETLRHPMRHTPVAVAMMVAIVRSGRRSARHQGFAARRRNRAFPHRMHALAGRGRCIASPLASKSLRDRLWRRFHVSARRYFVASTATPLPSFLANGIQLQMASSISATQAACGTESTMPAFCATMAG